MNSNVHKLSELVKSTHSMCNWDLGDGYENNPIYKNLEQMMKVVEEIRLDDVSKRMTELYSDLIHIGYSVEYDCVNFILQKLLFEQLQTIYKLVESYIENPTIHLVLDNDTLLVEIDDRETSLTSTQIIKIHELVNNSYSMELKFKVLYYEQ